MRSVLLHLLCEMAAYEKEKGRSLFEKLVDLYVQYGFYLEELDLHHQKRNGWTKTNCGYDGRI